METRDHPVKRALERAIAILVMFATAVFIAVIITLIDRDHIELSTNPTPPTTPTPMPMVDRAEKYSSLFVVYCPTPYASTRPFANCYLLPLHTNTRPDPLLPFQEQENLPSAITLYARRQSENMPNILSPTLAMSILSPCCATTTPTQEINAAATPTPLPMPTQLPAPTSTPIAIAAIPTVPPDAPDPVLVAEEPKERTRRVTVQTTNQTRCPRIHVIRPGENLFRLALRYGTTVEAIMRANGIKDPRFVPAYARLRIPCR